MAEMMAYAASVGSARAKRKVGAVASSATPRTRRRISSAATGARHHAACADRLCRLDVARGGDVPRDVPRRAMTVLVDYFAREISDSLEVCQRFPDLAAKGMLSLRLDTTGGRYFEGL
jgi:nicotinate phosphoribosyltransferase